MRALIRCAVPLLVATAIGILQAQSSDAKPPSPGFSQAQDSAAPSAAPIDKSKPSSEAQSGKSQQDSSDKRKWRLRLGGVAVGAGYTHDSAPIYPYWYPFPYYAPYGFYPGDWVTAPLWYPLWSPSPFYGPRSFAYNNRRGEVRLSADPKDPGCTSMANMPVPPRS